MNGDAPRRARITRSRGRTALAAIGSAIVGCQVAGCTTRGDIPATLTVRNDATRTVDVHFAVLGPDGNPATPGEAGIQHMTVDSGGVQSRTVEDPTGAIPKAARGSTVVRALVTLADAGPDAGQWLDLKPPGPWVVRAAPMGTGIRAELAEDRPPDDRQMRDLTQQEPPRPGRSSRP